MNTISLYYLHKALTTDKCGFENLRRLEVITALDDNDFPLDIWVRDGLLDKMVSFVENAYYDDYMSGGHNTLGARDLDDFCYALHDVCTAQGAMYVEHPDEADLDGLYDILESMN